MKEEISVCWFRRDLRLDDNAALYEALRGPYPVLPLFIFDTKILKKLSNREDPRVTFIHHTLQEIHSELATQGSTIAVEYGTPEEVWIQILKNYNVKAVYTNHDYEPNAIERDDALAEYLASEQIEFKTFKDQVIFEKNEILKADGKPYTVFTPYFQPMAGKA